jgi:hypothetical protein
MRRQLQIVLTWLGLVVLAACNGSDTTSPPGTGTVEVRLADAPADDFQSATIFVSQVYLVGQGVGAREELIADTKASFDLLTLQNGVTTLLANSEVEAGGYAQLRLVVDSAVVVLASGRTFADGSTWASLRVPSGSESGLKVNLNSPVSVRASETTTLLVDFSVDRSFLFQGPGNQPTSVMFRPVLHALDLNTAGTIRGTVSPFGVYGNVYAITGTDTTQTTFIDSGGSYALRFLPPGTYTVSAVAAGFDVAISSPVTLAAAESQLGVNLTLLPLP